jgi:hypothetical protein
MKNKFLLLLVSATIVFSCKNEKPEPNVKILTLQPGPNDGQDGEVNSLFPDIVSFNGNGKFLNPMAWTYNGVINVKRAYIKFDFSEISKTSIIDSAFINLYFSNALIKEFPVDVSEIGHIGDNELEIQRITSTWKENELNWSNKPNTTETNSVIIPKSKSETQDYLNINVKELIKDILKSSNYGFAIKHKKENIYKFTSLTSSEEEVPARRPKLIIYYH